MNRNVGDRRGRLRMEAGMPGRGVGDSSEENGANDKSFAPQTYLRSDAADVAVGFVKNT